MLSPSLLRVSVGILTGIILLLTAAWLSGSTGQICEYDQSSAQNECASYGLPIYVLVKGGLFLNFYGALIAGLATIAIAAFTYTLKQSTDQLAQTHRATAEAQERDTKIIQRAYLAVEPDGIRPMRSDIGKLLGYVTIKNVGHLPARNVSAFVSIKYANGDHYNDFSLGVADGSYVVAPGIFLRQGSSSFDKSVINKLSKDKLFFYVWGAVYYNDGFVYGRHTRFCQRYRWEIFGEPEGRLTAPAEDARYHEYGNGTDEDP
jgi:hypothetical protein